MKKIIGYDAKYWLPNIALSLTVSFAAVFCIPDIVNWSMGVEAGGGVFPFVGLIGAVAISFLTLLFLRHSRCNKKLVLTVLATFIALVLMTVVLSMLCGIIAWVLYFLLRNLLNFGQIKGIIDFLATIIVVLGMPLMVSVFWREMSTEKGFVKAFADGLAIKGKRYIKLLALLLVLFGCGLLITTMFHYIQINFLTNLAKMVLFAVVGTVGMNLSEKIIK